MNFVQWNNDKNQIYISGTELQRKKKFETGDKLEKRFSSKSCKEIS